VQIPDFKPHYHQRERERKKIWRRGLIHESHASRDFLLPKQFLAKALVAFSLHNSTFSLKDQETPEAFITTLYGVVKPWKTR
jgi:hypothetical protein